MSYEVIMPETIKTRIARWDLSAYLIFRIDERLFFGDLAEHLSRHLERIPEPADLLQYIFVLADPATPSREYLFVFDVVYAADEACLIVKDRDDIAG